MNTEESSIVQFIESARHNDALAQQQLWDRYFPQLVKLARQRLHEKYQRIGDAEDVALSVLNSFFQRVRNFSFPEVRGDDDLWRLLSRIAQRKATDWIRFQQRQKRRVLGESAVGGLCGSEGDSAAVDRRPLAELPAMDLEPQLAAMFVEDCEQLMARLPIELRPIVLQRLAGYTNAEIAQSQQCSLATIERRLKLIRSIWSDVATEDPP
jgi:RNA polymerase sigma factor (sigma-70 family)